MTILQARKIVEDAPAPPAALDPSLRIEAAMSPPRGGMVALAIALAFALHAGLVALAVFGDRLDRSNVEDTKAIPVELVPDVPKPPPAPKIDWPEPPKDLAKPEPKPKPSPEKPEPPKPEAPKPAPPKPAPPKPAPEKPPASEKPPEPAKPPKQEQPQKVQPPARAAPNPAPAPAPASPPPPPPPAAAGGPLLPGDARPPPAALVQPPAPPLTHMNQIYAPMAMDLPVGTFRQRALTAAGQKEADDYKAEVFALLEQAKEVPQSARARGAKGVTIVGFTIDLSGNLVSASVLHSSGDPELDAAALDTVRRAAPFPLPPPEAQRSFTPALVFGEE